MNALPKMQKLAKRYGFALIRMNRHLVFRDAAGRIVTTALTPSDGHALKNAERQFIRTLKTPKPIRTPPTT